MKVYEYGAMSSKYSVEAENKLTAYAAMIVHYNSSAHLIAIYSPEESKEDNWMSFTGQISDRLDEIYGGKDAFDNYINSNVDKVRECLKTRKQLI